MAYDNCSTKTVFPTNLCTRIKVLNSRITSHGLVSTMTYLPQSDVELITLACWASNMVGHQTTPCLIHILPASKYTVFYHPLFKAFRVYILPI